MAEQPKKYTHLAVLVQTQKKVSILASVTGESILDLVEIWAAAAWEKAKKEGLVTDAMIQPQGQSPSKQKKSAVSARQIAIPA
jgi:hypothetical protein